MPRVTKKSAPITVAQEYRFIIGVDTHAATHSYAIIEAPNGGLVDQQTFPTSPVGLTRARDWIAQRTGGEISSVLIAAEGTGYYGAVLAEVLAEVGYRVVEAPTPRRERGRGKTDEMDAVIAARDTLAMPLVRLRDRRGGQDQVALQVLNTASEQLNAERLRAINALTALVRSHDLGIDARRALSNAQIKQIAGWRRRTEPLGIATARAEAVRLAARVTQLDIELKTNRKQSTSIVTARAPELLELPGVGAVTAAVILCVWSHPGRVRSEAALAQIAGTCPIPALSGNTVRHRLNRGGDRRFELGPEHHRAHPNARRPHYPGLHRTPHRRRQDPTRDPPLSQALHDPPDLPDPERRQPARSVRGGLTTHRSV